MLSKSYDILGEQIFYWQTVENIKQRKHVVVVLMRN